MDYVRREVEERQLVEEAIDPDGIEGFGHVEENCAGEPLFVEMPGYSLNEADSSRWSEWAPFIMVACCPACTAIGWLVELIGVAS